MGAPLKAAFRRINIMRAVAVATYKEWAAYRTHSMVSIFVGPVFYLSQYFIWRSIYGNGQVIGGLTLEQMLTYMGVASLIGYLTMDFADWNLQMLIHTGKYVTFALRPVHHRYFALCQKIGHRTLGFLFEFLPVFFIFTFVFKINLMPARLFWTLLSIGFSFLMTFYFNYSVGLTGFWLTRTSGLRSVLLLLCSIFSGSLLPLSFFPAAIQKLLFFLPFQFITYVPAMVFTGRYTLGGFTMDIPRIVCIQGVYVLGMALFSQALYAMGSRRYTGVGV